MQEPETIIEDTIGDVQEETPIEESNIVENSKSRKKGTLLREIDVMEWTQKQFLEYFMFTDFFYDEQGTIKITKDKVRAVEQYAKSSDMFAELLVRVNRPSTMIDWKKASFFMRVNSIFRTVKLWIVKNPDCISPLIVSEQRSKIQFSWMNDVYDAEGKKKPPKVEVVPFLVPDEKAKTVDGSVGTLMEAINEVSSIYLKIAESITDEDIKKMKPGEKISALQKLSYIHNTSKKFKQNVNFIKVNTKSGSASDLESALLDFTNEEE